MAYSWNTGLNDNEYGIEPWANHPGGYDGWMQDQASARGTNSPFIPNSGITQGASPGLPVGGMAAPQLAAPAPQQSGGSYDPNSGEWTGGLFQDPSGENVGNTSGNWDLWFSPEGRVINKLTGEDFGDVAGWMAAKKANSGGLGGAFNDYLNPLGVTGGVEGNKIGQYTGANAITKEYYDNAELYTQLAILGMGAGAGIQGGLAASAGTGAGAGAGEGAALSSAGSGGLLGADWAAATAPASTSAGFAGSVGSPVATGAGALPAWAEAGATTGGIGGGTTGLMQGASAGGGSTALGRLLGLGQTGQDVLSVGGAVLPGLLGYLGQKQQTDALTQLGQQYFNVGGPARGDLRASYGQDFDLMSQPGYGDAFQRTADISARSANVQYGNPYDAAAQSQIMNNVWSQNYLPALANYRGQLMQEGGMGLNTSGQISGAGASLQGSQYTPIAG